MHWKMLCRTVFGELNIQNYHMGNQCPYSYFVIKKILSLLYFIFPVMYFSKGHTNLLDVLPLPVMGGQKKRGISA